MADDTYLFIDGEYLRQIHREAMRDFFGTDGELDIHEAKRQAGQSARFFTIRLTKPHVQERRKRPAAHV